MIIAGDVKQESGGLENGVTFQAGPCFQLTVGSFLSVLKDSIVAYKDRQNEVLFQMPFSRSHGS